MRRVALSLCLCALAVCQPAVADAQSQVLAPGKPSGVHQAQSGNLMPVYGGVLLLGVILYATIITSGSAVAPSTVSTNSINSNGLTTG